MAPRPGQTQLDRNRGLLDRMESTIRSFESYDVDRARQRIRGMQEPGERVKQIEAFTTTGRTSVVDDLERIRNDLQRAGETVVTSGRQIAESENAPGWARDQAAEQANKVFELFNLWKDIRKRQKQARTRSRSPAQARRDVMSLSRGAAELNEEVRAERERLIREEGATQFDPRLPDYLGVRLPEQILTDRAEIAREYMTGPDYLASVRPEPVLRRTFSEPRAANPAFGDMMTRTGQTADPVSDVVLEPPPTRDVETELEQKARAAARALDLPQRAVRNIAAPLLGVPQESASTPEAFLREVNRAGARSEGPARGLSNVVRGAGSIIDLVIPGEPEPEPDPFAPTTAESLAFGLMDPTFVAGASRSALRPMVRAATRRGVSREVAERAAREALNAGELGTRTGRTQIENAWRDALRGHTGPQELEEIIRESVHIGAPQLAWKSPFGGEGITLADMTGGMVPDYAGRKVIESGMQAAAGPMRQAGAAMRELGEGRAGLRGAVGEAGRRVENVGQRWSQESPFQRLREREEAMARIRQGRAFEAEQRASRLTRLEDVARQAATEGVTPEQRRQLVRETIDPEFVAVDRSVRPKLAPDLDRARAQVDLVRARPRTSPDEPLVPATGQVELTPGQQQLQRNLRGFLESAQQGNISARLPVGTNYNPVTGEYFPRRRADRPSWWSEAPEADPSGTIQAARADVRVPVFRETRLAETPGAAVAGGAAASEAARRIDERLLSKFRLQRDERISRIEDLRRRQERAIASNAIDYANELAGQIAKEEAQIDLLRPQIDYLERRVARYAERPVPMPREPGFEPSIDVATMQPEMVTVTRGGRPVGKPAAVGERFEEDPFRVLPQYTERMTREQAKRRTQQALYTEFGRQPRVDPTTGALRSPEPGFERVQLLERPTLEGVEPAAAPSARALQSAQPLPREAGGVRVPRREDLEAARTRLSDLQTEKRKLGGRRSAAARRGDSDLAQQVEKQMRAIDGQIARQREVLEEARSRAGLSEPRQNILDERARSQAEVERIQRAIRDKQARMRRADEADKAFYEKEIRDLESQITQRQRQMEMEQTALARLDAEEMLSTEVDVPTWVVNMSEREFARSPGAFTEALQKTGVPALGAVGRGLDFVMSNFKRNVLAGNPGYHVMNVASDSLMLHAAGMNNLPGRLATAARQIRSGKVPPEARARGIATGRSADPGAGERMEIAGGAGNRAADRVIRLAEGKSPVRPRRLAGRVLTLEGERFAQFWEDTSKLALFNWARSRGMSPDEAATYTFNMLVDYGRRQPFEERLRLVLPFTRWLVGAPGAVARMAYERPGRLQAQRLAIQGAFGGEETEEAPDYYTTRGWTMPASAALRGAYSFGRQALGGSPLSEGEALFVQPRWGPAEAMAPLARLAEGDLAPWVAQQVNPLWKTALEMGLGRNVVTGRPIQYRPTALMPPGTPGFSGWTGSSLEEPGWLGRNVAPLFLPPTALLAGNMLFDAARGEEELARPTLGETRLGGELRPEDRRAGTILNWLVPGHMRPVLAGQGIRNRMWSPEMQQLRTITAESQREMATKGFLETVEQLGEEPPEPEEQGWVDQMVEGLYGLWPTSPPSVAP